MRFFDYEVMIYDAYQDKANCIVRDLVKKKGRYVLVNNVFALICLCNFVPYH